MRRHLLQTASRLALGVVAGMASAVAAQADDLGVVRISDQRQKPVVRAQSPDDYQAILPAQCADEPGYHCPPSGPACGTAAAGCPSLGCRDSGFHGDGGCPDHGGLYDPNCSRCRLFGGQPHGDVYCPDGRWVQCPDGRWDWFPNHQSTGFWEGLGNHVGDFCRNRRDCFNMGFFKGPDRPLFGCYDIVYPADPYYFDKRDGQVYAAQGYGGPVSVPLAPMVRHTYNYGWGVPSSRLTPISHPVPLTTLK